MRVEQPRVWPDYESKNQFCVAAVDEAGDVTGLEETASLWNLRNLWIEL